MKKILLLLFLIALGGARLTAQKEWEFSLQQAIDYAIENNLNVKISEKNILDADAQIIERRAVGIPQLNGEVNYQHFFKVPASVLPEQFEEIVRIGNGGELPPDFTRQAQFAFKNNFDIGLSLNSLVFDGSYFTGLKAAKVFKKYVSQELKATQEQVANQVVDAYLPALIINENVAILDKNIKNVEELLFGTKETYKAGFVEQLDVDRLELSLSNLKVERETLTRQMELVINSLKFVMGFPLQQELSLKDDLNTLFTEASNEELVGRVNFSNRPEYLVADMGITLNNLNVDLFKAGYLPSVSAFANYQYAYQGNSFFGEDGFWAPTLLAGVRVSVPIFDGFEKKAQVERARLGLDIAQMQQKELERVITLEVENARNEYLNAKQRVESQTKNLTLAEKIYNTTSIKYKEGVGSSLELSNAERELYQTQQLMINARYELLTAKRNLDKALGNVR